MGANRADIEESQHWVAGEDRTVDVDVKQSDGTTPQTMTGWALTWELREGRTGAVRLSKTTAAGVVIMNGAGTNDRARISIAKADTVGLAPRVYHHELRRTDAGSSLVLCFGDAHLLKMGVS